ncbi:MAG TPA: alanine dehydrogenase [Chromatiaceae bacterium]|jgi:alanine dehydrogenase|nr:alanine dehydrogenase [Chromatiaceae bacterium]HIA08261.1 alanine dehydrogenase [Chromatiaceae bacterium]
MNIGIPKETKPLEGRIALIPAACAELIKAGHRVWVETGAGRASGYPDEDYRHFGVTIAQDATVLFQAAELLLKVKEPTADELALLTADHILFCFLHLAVNEALTDELRSIGLCAIAFETVAVEGRLPLLAPMSNIAGRIAVQVGTHLLHAPQGGRGVLLGGIDGSEPGRVVVLGGGVAGGNATRLAAAGGAQVTVFDRNPQVLDGLRGLGANVDARAADPDQIAATLAYADLVIGAVLIPGQRAPQVITEAMIRAMSAGSVVVDISVDQGGCVATTRPTTYDDPTYVVDGVTHFTVTNMPGAVPRTGSQALSSVLTPWVLRIAVGDSWREDEELVAAINVDQGEVIHPALLA